MQNKPLNTTNTEEENLISWLIFRFMPYWPLFLLFLILSIGVAYAYLSYTNAKYEATATLIIKDERKGYDDSQMLESLDLINTKKIIENEVEVLQSRTLMDTVIKALHLYAPQFEEGKIKTTSAYLTSPVTIEAADPDGIKDSLKDEKIYFRYNVAEVSVSLNDSLRFKLNEWVKTPYGFLKFKPNEKYQAPKEAKPLYFTLVPPKDAVQDLLGDLTVTPSSKLSTIVYLNFTDEVPVRGEDILNELIKSYNLAAINEKNNLAKNTLSFVEDRLNAVGKDLDSIENKIQRYKSGKDAVDISTQGQLFLQNVSANDQKMSDVSMRLAVLDQVEKSVTAKNNSGSIVPSTLGVNDPVLSELLNKLYASELEYEKLKSTVGENNHLLLSVADQINKIRPDILENIQSQRQGLVASKGNISTTNGTYNSMLKSIPGKERQLLEISRQQSIKNGIYSFLLQKREETALSFASTASDSRIVDKAESSIEPISPKPKIIYLVAMIAAIALAAGIIILREMLNGKISHRKELEAMTSFPILGEVAYQKGGTPIVIERGKRTFIAEEFRKLRVSLPFLGIGDGAKKILVTSSISGEGKSFIASNLAVSLSLTGKKVVLVDFDLNNPSLNNLLGTKDQPGVSDYLAGNNEPEDIIRRVDNHPDLFFVASGSSPDNPSELISHGRVKTLIEYLENSFDFVVMDTAPVVPVSDTYMLSGYCDATLYVVRHKFTPKTIIKRLDENNKINSLTNPAIVFNGVRPRGFFKKNYSYGYGYGYVNKSKKSGKKKKKSLV